VILQAGIAFFCVMAGISLLLWVTSKIERKL
jgi:hypothetical protein